MFSSALLIFLYRHHLQTDQLQWISLQHFRSQHSLCFSLSLFPSSYRPLFSLSLSRLSNLKPAVLTFSASEERLLKVYSFSPSGCCLNCEVFLTSSVFIEHFLHLQLFDFGNFNYCSFIVIYPCRFFDINCMGQVHFVFCLTEVVIYFIKAN